MSDPFLGAESLHTGSASLSSPSLDALPSLPGHTCAHMHTHAHTEPMLKSLCPGSRMSPCQECLLQPQLFCHL